MTPLHRAWTEGVIHGLREYAWTGAGGVIRVGHPQKRSCKPLEEAIKIAESVWKDDGDDGDDAGRCPKCGVLRNEVHKPSCVLYEITRPIWRGQ